MALVRKWACKLAGCAPRCAFRLHDESELLARLSESINKVFRVELSAVSEVFCLSSFMSSRVSYRNFLRLFSLFDALLRHMCHFFNWLNFYCLIPELTFGGTARILHQHINHHGHRERCGAKFNSSRASCLRSTRERGQHRTQAHFE